MKASLPTYTEVCSLIFSTTNTQDNIQGVINVPLGQQEEREGSSEKLQEGQDNKYLSLVLTLFFPYVLGKSTGILTMG